VSSGRKEASELKLCLEKAVEEVNELKGVKTLLASILEEYILSQQAQTISSHLKHD
jgi:hypothetical protein